MSDQPVTVTDDTSLESVAQTMSRRRISRLPVVDETGELLGIVSIFDVMRALASVQMDRIAPRPQGPSLGMALAAR